MNGTPRPKMDLADGVAVRHAVAFTTLNIRHSIELSPSIVSVAKEIRYCIIAIVVGFSAVSIVRNLLGVQFFNKQSRQPET